MPVTRYPEVNDLLDTLLARIKAALGDKLIGFYLSGSLVTGDYDPRVSDVDLVTAIRDSLNDAEFAALERMHAEIVAADPQWDDRIEIIYITRHALQTFKTERSPLAVISPGEPFHYRDAGIDWLMNWYMVREKAITLYGADPAAIIAPIPQAEFLQAVRDHACAWREYIEWGWGRPGQGYAVLTLCRALYTLAHGDQVSKIKAAAWAQEQMPEWSGLIADALAWRQLARIEVDADPALTLPEVRRFVEFVINEVCT